MKKILPLICLASHVALASNPKPLGNDYLYYEIGGGTSIPHSTYSNQTNIPFEFSAQMNTGSVCSKFKPAISIKNSMNNISNLKDDMGHVLIDQAKHGLVNLGPYLLARFDPTLYDIFQNAMVTSKDKLSIATKSCERMEGEIRSGKNPYEDLIKVSNQNGWKKQISLGGDIVTAKQTVEEKASEDGFLWLNDESRGGKNQKPIYVISDVSKHTYDKLIQGEGFQQDSIWSSSEDLRLWLLDVIGEYELQTYNPSQNKVISGRGLFPKIENDKEFIAQDLQDLVNGHVAINDISIDKVSSYGVQLSDKIIYTIANMPPHYQELYIGRISEDIAISKNLQKALDAKRILRMGKDIPHTQQIEPVVNILDSATKRLDSEIQDVLQTIRIRKELVSQTVLSLMGEQDKRAKNLATNLKQDDNVGFFGSDILRVQP